MLFIYLKMISTNTREILISIFALIASLASLVSFTTLMMSIMSEKRTKDEVITDLQTKILEYKEKQNKIYLTSDTKNEYDEYQYYIDEYTKKINEITIMSSDDFSEQNKKEQMQYRIAAAVSGAVCIFTSIGAVVSAKLKTY